MNDMLVSRLDLLPPKTYPEPSTQLAVALGNMMGDRFLVTTRSDGRGHMIYCPKPGTTITSKAQANWVCTIGQDCSEVTLNALLLALKGGERYPIMAASMGVALAGMLALAGGLIPPLTIGAGALYAGTNAAVGVHHHSMTRNFLPRPDDRIVCVQAFGKVKDEHIFTKDSFSAVYVCMYALVDPYRMKGKCGTQGWVFGETRLPVTLG